MTLRRARCRTQRPHRARTRVREALDRLDLDAGLPRSAILVVRRLEGALSGNPPRVEGVDLRKVAAQAHRPSVSPPPAHCDAVLFADEAELLVCLCRDVAQRRPLAWWWRAVLGHGAASPPPSPDRLIAASAAFDRLARAIPAAVATAPHSVAAAAAELPRRELFRIMGTMAEAHGAPALAEVIRPVWQAAPTSGTAAAADGVPGGADVVPVPTSQDASPRGSTTTSPSPPPRDGVVALLVGTAIQLHRDPVAARSARAAATVAARLAALAAGDSDHGRDVLPVGGAASPSALARSGPRSGDQLTTSDAGSATEAAAGAPGHAATASPASGAAASEADDTTAEPTADDAPDRIYVDTALGGAFYLLTFFERLDLPGSTDGPGEPREPLTRWAMLALVLRAWPDVDPEDPLLTVLDDLAWPDADDAPLSAPGADDLLRWGERVAEELVARLVDDGLEPGIVIVPARVEVSGFSVRVHMALDDIDLGVRRAGLDRDPGWVPELGRVVELVFR